MKPPRTLKGEALGYWKRNAPLCEKMGTLTPADVDSFTQLCRTWGRLDAAEANGASSIEFVCLNKQFTQQTKAFGLDPLSRRKLKIDDHQDEPDEYGV